jgi:hypothetical protein
MARSLLVCGSLETYARHLDPGDVAFVEVKFEVSVILADVI